MFLSPSSLVAACRLPEWSPMAGSGFSPGGSQPGLWVAYGIFYIDPSSLAISSPWANAILKSILVPILSCRHRTPTWIITTVSLLCCCHHLYPNAIVAAILLNPPLISCPPSLLQKTSGRQDLVYHTTIDTMLPIGIHCHVDSDLIWNNKIKTARWFFLCHIETRLILLLNLT